MEWFWYFVIYSFLGFCLEVLFARVTQQSKRDRKCFLFLPLCPVYGLGALWILALPAPVRDHPILLFLVSSLASTGAEYAMSLFYERLTGVHFWDYRHLPFHLHGRVCLLFSVFWGILGVGAIHVLHPAVIRFTAQLPPFLWLFAACLLLLDGSGTLVLLRRTHSTDILCWYRRIPRFPLRDS